MSAEIIQFIPRPRHDRETDFPTIAFITPAKPAGIIDVERVRQLIEFAKEGAPADRWSDRHSPDKEPA